MGKTFEEKLVEARESVPAISPREANAHKANDPAVVFIDPRNEADIRATTGIIPGALNITLDDLNGKSTNELPMALSDQSCPIITACQAGPLGALAAHALKTRGYHNVKYMDGGTQGWIDAGFTTH